MLQKRSKSLPSIVKEFCKWDVEDVCNVRRVWLKCKGIPLHGWSQENIEKIGETWGRVVQCNIQTQELEDFQAAKV